MTFPCLDFFAGGGLAATGLSARFHPVWANDVCPAKAAVYAANHDAGHFRLGSVADVRGAELPEAALSWASFPCQDLSLAGRMDGLGGRRSGLVWEWLRVMDEMAVRPPVLAVENVAGLVSAERGRHYLALHEALARRGYRVGALLINAERWLPQSRPRVFVAAVRRNADLTGLTAPGPGWAHPPAVVQAAGLASDFVWWRLPEPPPRRLGLSDLIDPDAPCHDEPLSQRNLALIPERHRQALDEAVRGGRRAVPGYKRTRDGRQVLELRFDDVAGCLRTPEGGSSRQLLVVARQGSFRTRLLTLSEAAALMGAPGYRLPGRYNAGYKALGDAVAVPAVRFLAEELLAPLARRATE